MNCPHCKKEFELCDECSEPITSTNSKDGICYKCVPVCGECGNDEIDCTCDEDSLEDDDDVDVDVELDSEEENAG